MTDYQQVFDRYVAEINSALPDYLPHGDCPQASVVRAMRYALTNGGKRVRAVLLLAFFDMMRDGGGDQPGGLWRNAPSRYIDEAMPFAAAIEMIHAYSLIHDDLPCMDNDDMRRGKPACHIAFGEDIALLAGDALLTRAFEITTDDACVKRLGAGKAITAVNALAGAAGWGGMIGGQVMDLENEGRAVTVETLRMTDEKKTGALIAVSARIGCVLAGADQTLIGAAATYALNLGIAFQIVDDILDVTGDAALLGKPIGSDSDNMKSTYTAHYGVAGARAEAGNLSAEAGDALKQTGKDAGFLLWLTDFLLRRQY